MDLDMWNVSAYATYESGMLSKYVVINFDEWNSTTSYARPVQQISLDVPPEVVGAKAEYLAGGGADVDTGITLAGMSYTYENLGLGVMAKNDTTMVTPVNGILNVSVQSTEAIVVTLMRNNVSTVQTNGTADGLRSSLGWIGGVLALLFVISLV